jgi:Tol biopolymer transport system component
MVDTSRSGRPMGRDVGFFAGGKLKRINVSGGAVQTLASIVSGGGGWWTSDDTILFSPNRGNGGIYRIAANGGAPAPVTRPPESAADRFPQPLPDGRHLIVSRRGTDESGVYAADPNGDVRKLADGTRAVYLSSGHLLIVRQRQLLVQAFDATRLAVSGQPSVVADQVLADAGGAVSASASGVVLYRTGDAGQRQFIWVNRTGTEVQRIGEPVLTQSNPSLSPDGRSVILQRTVSNNTDVWQLDLERGVFVRITSHTAVDALPVWSPDGRRIAFTSTRGNTTGSDIFQKVVGDGPETEKLLFSSPHLKAVSDWSPDGQTLLYRDTDPRSNTADIWALPLSAPKQPFPVVQTMFDERDAQFAPDGRWIAYQSDETGESEIYVRPFPGPGRSWPVSSSGGAQVRWRADGKELFYLALDGTLMAVKIRLASVQESVEIGAPTRLFVTHIGGPLGNVARQQYVVAPRGDQFLLNTFIDNPARPPITMLVNWTPR